MTSVIFCNLIGSSLRYRNLRRELSTIAKGLKGISLLPSSAGVTLPHRLCICSKPSDVKETTISMSMKRNCSQNHSPREGFEQRRMLHTAHSQQNQVIHQYMRDNDKERARHSYKDLFFGNVTIVRFAGHSKWANIRHIKAAKDGEKSQVAAKIAGRIKVAIREGGGADPKFNFQLARLLDQANKADVPKSTVENVIKNAIKSNKEGAVAFYEAKGPGNFMMVIETFTDNPKRTILEVNHCFKKFGGQLSDKIAAAFFDRKGVIMVKPGESLATLEDMEEAAIEAEAEEILEELDDGGNPLFSVICDPGTVYSVRKEMVANHPNVQIDNATHQYIPKPHSMAPLSGPTLEAAIKVVDAMEKLPDVVRVYTNIEVAEES